MTDAERRTLAMRLFGTGRPGEPGPLDPGWVVERLAGSRQTLSRWRKVGIPPDRIEEVLEAVREILPDTTKEAAEPEWVRRLEAKMDSLVASRERVADESVRKVVEALAATPLQLRAEELIDHLEERLRLRAEVPPEQSGEPDPGEVLPPGQVGG